MSSIFPPPLGRGVVLAPGAPIPEPWAEAPRLTVDAATLARPQQALQRLHHHWARRLPLVIELGISAADLREPESLRVEPFTLKPTFEFARERLHFLIWANNYDATRGEPVWWHARLAQRLGCPPSAEAEVEWEDQSVWCDGGPRGNVPFPVLHRESIESRILNLTLPLDRPLPEGAFDPEQSGAVRASGTAFRVLAPAGSGKTRVLTGRFRHLLESGFEPGRICALAYNRRAAGEMVERLAVGGRSVRTLHSLGYGLLKRYHPGIGVASPNQVRQMLRDLIRLAPQVNSDPMAPYLEALGAVRMGLRSPEEVEAERDDIPGFAAAFPRYRQRLAQANLVDHDEQIYSCLELLLSNPTARKLAQLACTHLLVDEFQDLTPAFLLMIRLLSAPGYQLFGVGDDDQVIYGYSGASPDYLVRFESYFPESTGHLLLTNYRCPGSVVGAACNLLSHNAVRVDKAVRAFHEESHGLEVTQASNLEWAQRALLQIQAWSKQRPLHEIAVLSRVNAMLMPLQVLLQQQAIPHSKVVDESVLERTGIRSALAYWRLCTGPEAWEGDDLRDALRRPNRMLKREIIEGASRCRNGLALQRYASKLDPWPASQVEEFMHDLTLLSGRARRGPQPFFQALRQETAFTSALDSLDNSGLGAAGSSHRDDLLALESLAGLCKAAPGQDFEEWLRDWLRAEPVEDGGVRLSSVHRVKGLEWPFVLLYGVDDGLFPHRLAEDKEEERRIFHVALTRAQETCVLLTSPAGISPFVAELMRVKEPPAPPKKKKKKGKKVKT